MPMRRRIALIGAAFWLGTAALFAHVLKEGDLPKQITRLPWETSRVNWGCFSHSDAQIVMLGHYVKPNLLYENDGPNYFGVIRKRYRNGKEIGSSANADWGRYCFDDSGADDYCFASSELKQADRSGFNFTITVQSRKKMVCSTATYAFRCLWVEEQAFKKDGFTFTLTIKARWMQPLRAPWSSK